MLKVNESTRGKLIKRQMTLSKRKEYNRIEELKRQIEYNDKIINVLTLFNKSKFSPEYANLMRLKKNI